jgi:hypothetical protein
MFERYTEKARRVIFFARYEASHYGAPAIETEHLLLGFLRESQDHQRWSPDLDADTVRERVDAQSPKRSPIPTSVDLPLSQESKHVLKFASDEAERLAQQHIGTEHLFLGMLEVRDCFAAKLLREAGADAATIRSKIAEDVREPLAPSQRGAPSATRGHRLAAATVEIHGTKRNADYIRDVVSTIRSYNWHWHKSAWKPQDLAIHRKSGKVSLDATLAEDGENFMLVKQGWKKDRCFICGWELLESEDEHGTGYTNGRNWLCMECCERFLQGPDFFASSHSDIT